MEKSSLKWDKPWLSVLSVFQSLRSGWGGVGAFQYKDVALPV